MKSFLLAAAAFVSPWFCPAVSAATYLIEGEAFQFKGRWSVEKSSECLGSAMLRVYNDGMSGGASDAVTVVNIGEAARYHVWTRSQDFESSARPRTYTLSIDGRPMSPSGAHGSAGFRWEKVGVAELARKQVMMRLADTGGYYGRCDAILLTDDASLDPNLLTNAEIARWRRNPVSVGCSTVSAPSLEAPKAILPGYSTVASADNGDIRLSFVRLADSGEIVCKTDYRHGGSWRRFCGAAEDHRVSLLCMDKDIRVGYDGFYPSWDRCTASRTITFEGVEYEVSADGDNTNPYFAGELSEPRPASVSKPSANSVRVVYDCGGVGELEGLWTLPERGSYVSVKFRFRPARTASYSIALHGMKGVGEEDCTGTLMPPMYAGRRLPASSGMLFSSMMTQALSVVSAGEVSAFVCADLDVFPQSWGSSDSSPVGFSLRNSRGEFQPVGFSPLPGMPDAVVERGGLVEASFVSGVALGGWDTALEYVSNNIFRVEDYRRPEGCSLTGVMENIVRLLKDDLSCGWAGRHKGFWDIEADGNTDPAVVQSAPLALLGVSAMTDDEELYERRALPAIEYVLSRGSYRTRTALPAELDPFGSVFPTTLYEGINTLSGGLNPWLEALALPGGEIRAANGYFTSVQPFRQELSAYRLTGDASRLSRAVGLADAFAQEILDDDIAETSPGNFYNSRMRPDWTPLLDICDAVGDGRYLEACARGAAHTIAGVRSWPRVCDGLMTLHPGGVYEGVSTVWWRGTERHRLGFPRSEGDAPEHTAEAWTVSPVGLGIEQPATYFVRSAGKNVRPVFMNSWAPRLMELSSRTGRDIYETYGRNAVIGRSQNYPGYYATGYTDITSSADFPYVGPDVSSIYYHHIPAFLAMIQDCLVTSVTARSRGAVSFVPARQEGFVWFANNVYGRAKGFVDGEEATLFLPSGSVSTDNPAVSVLAARARGRLYIILSNDGDRDVDTRIALGDILASRLTSGDGSGLRAVVPARDIAILSLEADFSDIPEPSPLRDGMQILETETPAGTVYLYRIRSPFGWDSLYGFAGCGAVEGLEIVAECEGRSVRAAEWPYEWSFSKFGCGDSPVVKVSIYKNGRLLSAVSGLFPSGESGLEAASPEPRPRVGIYNILGQKLDRISSPGFYIVDGRKIFKK